MYDVCIGPLITTSVTSEFKVCNLDPEDEHDMVWAKIRVKFIRLFRWVWVNSEPDTGCVDITVFDAKSDG